MRKDDPGEYLKRLKRSLAQAPRFAGHLRPASKLALLTEEARRESVAKWADEQRRRVASGLAPEAPPEVREQEKVRKISQRAFLDTFAARGPEIAHAVGTVFLDLEVQSAYRDWIGGSEHPILAFLAVAEDPYTAFIGDVVVGAEPDPNRLKAYVLAHARDLRATIEARGPREREAEFVSTLATPQREKQLPFSLTTSEGEVVEVPYHVRRGPVMSGAGQWRGVPSGIGEDPKLYSVFLPPNDPRFWEYAREVRRKEEKRAMDRANVFRKALAEVRAQGGDETRAGFWKRVHARMLQIGEELYRKRRRARREYFGGGSKSGTYHAGHRRKRRR